MWIIRVLVCAAVVLIGTGAAKEEEPIVKVHKPSAELWDKYIRNRPVRILDNWNLCNGLILCPQAGKIDNRLAVLGTVAFGGPYRVSVGEFVLTPEMFIDYARALKGAPLTEKERKRVEALCMKAHNMYGDRAMPIHYATFFMGEVLKLGLTVSGRGWLRGLELPSWLKFWKKKDEDWIRSAVRKIGRVHGWCATVEDGKNLPFEKYKEGVDKEVPVIVEKDDYYKLVVGYIDAAEAKYLVVVDPAEVPLEKSGALFTAKEREYYESLPPDDEMRRNYYEQEIKEKKYLINIQVRSTMSLPLGFVIEKFDISKYHAYFIHSWHKSAEAWRPEIEKILGKK